MCRVLIVLTALLLCGCNLQQGPLTPIPTLDAPRVEFRFPLNNSTVIEGSELTLELLATDAGAGVARIELLVDDVVYREGKPQVSPAVATFTVTMNWLAQGIGRHSFTATAYRQDGAASPPAIIVVEVLPAPTAGD